MSPDKIQSIQTLTKSITDRFNAINREVSTIMVSLDLHHQPNMPAVQKLAQLSSSVGTITASVLALEKAIGNLSQQTPQPDNDPHSHVDGLWDHHAQGNFHDHHQEVPPTYTNREQALDDLATSLVKGGGQLQNIPGISADMFSRETTERLSQTAQVPKTAVPQNALQRFKMVGAMNHINTDPSPMTQALSIKVFRPLANMVLNTADEKFNPYRYLVERIFPKAQIDSGKAIHALAYQGNFFPYWTADASEFKQGTGLFGRSTSEPGLNTYSELVFETARFLIKIRLDSALDHSIEHIVEIAPTWLDSYKTKIGVTWLSGEKITHQYMLAVAEDINNALN